MPHPPGTALVNIHIQTTTPLTTEACCAMYDAIKVFINALVAGGHSVPTGATSVTIQA